MKRAKRQSAPEGRYRSPLGAAAALCAVLAAASCADKRGAAPARPMPPATPPSALVPDPAAAPVAMRADQPSGAIAEAAPETAPMAARVAEPALAERPAALPRPEPAAPSSNLAGKDRFLTSLPFARAIPYDFEIGPLWSQDDDSAILNPMRGLLASLARRELATDAMGPDCARIAVLRYGQALKDAPAIRETRFGKPSYQAGGGYGVGIRLFSDTGSSTGLAVLYPDGADGWLIEYLELDLASLSAPFVRTEPWDPYGQTGERISR